MLDSHTSSSISIIAVLALVGVHVAKQQIGDFRLFGNGSNGAGAVQIFTSLGWSGICPDSSWTTSVARVFCQALGYDVGETRMHR